MAGDLVRIQDPKSLEWSTKGVVMKGITHEEGNIPVSYLVATESGDEFLRNGKFLRIRAEEARL